MADKRINIPEWLIESARRTSSPAHIASGYVRQSPVAPDQSAINKLMADIVAACERHGLWLAHEDNHGAFTVQRGSTSNWLKSAYGTSYDVSDQPKIRDDQ